MKLERQREHHVTRDGIIPSFGSALSIDGINLVGQLVQQVVSLKLGCNISLAEGTGQHGVPYQIVGVHLVTVITFSGKHSEVCLNTHFHPRDGILQFRATFNPVASRIAQAATLKAEKAGKGTVDLDAAKGKTPASTNENNPSL